MYTARSRYHLSRLHSLLVVRNLTQRETQWKFASSKDRMLILKLYYVRMIVTEHSIATQVRFLEKQLCLAQEASDVEGGAIEVLEGLLRKRDADRELCRALDLKSLEIGMKIKLLETDTGGNTVEVELDGVHAVLPSGNKFPRCLDSFDSHERWCMFRVDSSGA